MTINTAIEQLLEVVQMREESGNALSSKYTFSFFHSCELLLLIASFKFL